VDRLRVLISARIIEKVEGGIGIETGYFFNAYPIFKVGIPYVELLYSTRDDNR